MQGHFNEVCKDFRKLWNFSNCCCTIDGKHVTAPPNTGSLNFNYKKYFSVLLMAISDSRYVFTSVFSLISVRLAAAVIAYYFLIPLSEDLNEKKLDTPEPRFLPETSMKLPCVFLGDGGFPLKENIMCSCPSHKNRAIMGTWSSS